MYYGDIRLGETHDFKFPTRQVSGAPTTLAGSPVISAYVGNSTTQLTAGITLTVDFDGVTGLNHIRVVATSGNGYATATDVDLVITTGTVNSVSVVGEVVASFSIENRSALMPTTAGRTLQVEADGMAYADAREWLGGTIPAVNVTGVPKVDPTHLNGTAQSLLDLKDFADDGYDPSTNKVQGVVLTDTLTTYTGNTVQTGDSFARLGVAGVGLTNLGDARIANLDATISSRASAASLVTAQADLDDLQTRVPAALVAGRMDSSVGAMANNVLTAAAIAANAIDRATFALDTGLKTLASGTVPSGSSTTVVELDSNALDTDDYYNGTLFQSTGQVRVIVDYVGATRLATLDPPLIAAIPAFSNYQVMPWGPAAVATWAGVPVTSGDLALSTLATVLAGVATEILDALRTDTVAAPTGVPGDTVALAEQIGRLYQALINGIVVDTATNKLQFKNAAGTVIWEKDLTDDGTTYTESKGNAP